ncbi:MAG: tetratricopeptide repeat protein [Bacteroidetes bacterium]|nr:MAG: tetratricopeptide repeat protein [Bacteroidota bacterium]
MPEEFGFHDFEEHRARQHARDFEKRLRNNEHFFIDLYQVDEIFQYYVQERSWDKAQRLLAFALETYASNADLYFKMARLEVERGEMDTALEEIDTALQFSPGNYDYLLARSEVLARLDRYEEACELLEGLIPLTEHPEEVFLQLGNVAQVCNEFEDSARYYRQALQLAPDYEEALMELGFLLESEDRGGEALSLYERYLDDNPYSASIWYQLGLWYHKAGNYERALEALEYALVIQDDFAAAYLYKGQVQMDLERYHDALRTFLEAGTIAPRDPNTLYQIAECYEHLDLFPEAIRYYSKVTELDPDYLEAWVGMGFCLEKRERYLEAVHFYHKAFRLDEENEEVCLALAICEYKLGNQHSAYLFLERAIALAPDELTIWQDWSELLYEQENYPGAISMLEEGIKLNPGLSPLYYQCAAYCLSSGFPEKGLMYLENALLMDYDAHDLLFHYEPGLRDDRDVRLLLRQYRA